MKSGNLNHTNHTNHTNRVEAAFLIRVIRGSFPLFQQFSFGQFDHFADAQFPVADG
jgi:hypothetical protein